MSSGFYSPVYFKLSNIRDMFGYILYDHTRPPYIRLHPKPKNINLIAVEEDVSFDNLLYYVDYRLKRIKFNEVYDIYEFFNRFRSEWLVYENDREYAIHKYNIYRCCLLQEVNRMWCYKNILYFREEFGCYFIKDAYADDWYWAYRYTRHQVVFLDCEMYLTDKGNEVGRISIVDSYGDVIYDEYCMSENNILDYRTTYSGLTPKKIASGIPFDHAMGDIMHNIIGKNTIVCGHGLEHDFKAMKLFHRKVVDTAYMFMCTDSHKLKLSALFEHYFGETIQKGQHCSVEDARAVRDLVGLKINEVKEFNYLCYNYRQRNDRRISKIVVEDIDDLDNFRRSDKYLNVFLFKQNGQQYISYVPEYSD